MLGERGGGDWGWIVKPEEEERGHETPTTMLISSNLGQSPKSLPSEDCPALKEMPKSQTSPCLGVTLHEQGLDRKLLMPPKPLQLEAVR